MAISDRPMVRPAASADHQSAAMLRPLLIALGADDFVQHRCAWRLVLVDFVLLFAERSGVLPSLCVSIEAPEPVACHVGTTRGVRRCSVVR